MKTFFKRARSLLKRIILFFGYFLYRVLFEFAFARACKKGEFSYLTKEDFKIWKRSLCDMIKEYWVKGHIGFIRRKIIFSFCNSHFEIIRKTDPCDKNDPIVVLCVKNDIRRLQMLVDHYRALGVAKFAILDNISDDGTYEWMLDQPDIDLYRCGNPYQTNVKEGWINRLISYYGFDRWYIVTDSDELVVYENMETEPLSELTRKLDKAGIKRLKAITLDTYQESPLFKESTDIRRDFRWIDSDSYVETSFRAGSYRIRRFIGGPRYRLMNSRIPLDKHPLVYWERGTVSDDAHYQYPHKYINEVPCSMGILHYKFIDTDFEEFKRRMSKESGFVNHGMFYKQYSMFYTGHELKSFMYDGSMEFTSSETVKKIPFIEPLRLD